ncbi:MAG: efflux RND transporter periplasmic adaptor subunit [Alphaproteobacteria bacterium]|nr:efflux transporter periplasmic adaptor subunit [Hyphomonas sp.]MBR9807333.1 efflux RND transporter periplasmic adaptor subunit [Alphaproteobacteria bacterium]|tara:strand:+ start:1888 stop:2871 length:984 start_codon:yes stop_codon:yes gene_type:complete
MAVTKAFLTATALTLLSGMAAAQTLEVETSTVMDYRPVVARIEAGDTATARSRLQGVVSRLTIDEGDVVSASQVVAVVTDGTLAPQLAALSSRIQGLEAQIRQAEEDLARNEALFKEGFFPKARLDEQRTGLDVLKRTLSSAQSERRALSARQAEGQIRAPADSRVTEVNVVEGSIVAPGEVIASFATLDGIVRLSLPERHAAQMAEGETVTLRLPARGGDLQTATIVKVYPELRNGEVIADATVVGGLNALVGERVDVLAPVGERRAIRVPKEYVSTRYGVDFVRVLVGDRFVEAPVALAAPLADTDGQYEILSGLRPGDRIEKPE